MLYSAKIVLYVAVVELIWARGYTDWEVKMVDGCRWSNKTYIRLRGTKGKLWTRSSVGVKVVPWYWRLLWVAAQYLRIAHLDRVSRIATQKVLEDRAL